MKTRLTPYYITLIYDACLKSFWRKKALVKFLRQCRISDSFISTWVSGESKRDFLDRLFDNLPKNDNGRDAIICMAEYLMEQRSFPDLENWENSATMIKDAHDAISKLRLLHNKQEEEIISEQEKQKAKAVFRENQEKITRSQQALQLLNNRLIELSKKLGTQEAGYDFQTWFYDVLDFYEIPNRKPYSHEGRQIDGSLTLSGTTYLVELKFTSEQATANDIDSFYKKVITKADNTMGIMISISGYSKTAIKEASGNRTPLLLLDHSHIYLSLCGMMALGDIVERIRRHASQTSEAYLPSSRFTI